MRINDDLSKPVIVHASKLDWVASPSAGVDRRMLFRIGGEVARATSIVRYAPGSAFPRHTHGGGEEIVVLEGTFQDEHGDYPAGSYFRNPPGASHVPASKDGCTIFVRLWQFRDEDRTQVVRQPGEGQQVAPRPGASSVSVLFDDGHEEVRLEDWRPGEVISLANARGLEFFVLSGGLTIGCETLQPQGWGRLPAGVDLKARVGPQGVKIWIREAPLLHPDVCRLPG
ncbi:quercetin dioxygenase-like cupin family protein [Bradyrhizobium elkanii]|uniref:cupin domain-containing protein n=1 Tax=Bradyrhizobium elkanii TaxID=29448 RepID=UPI00216857B3|nr:cupin domain-containing protein [Bradyrhizobium elkanii]MCS3560392.1 quercetin dioxygenase-like cupin family protein [Bradyrhizobium elkanii]MCW2373494.1 quercetin dioxygenase-like cupin family protein [Bradyrhizobium elkanii]